MFRRKKEQPWWTVPIVISAAIFGLIQAELHTRFIWKTMIKRMAFHKLLDFLDRKFPPKDAKNEG